jgi:hypothetical protein
MTSSVALALSRVAQNRSTVDGVPRCSEAHSHSLLRPRLR